MDARSATQTSLTGAKVTRSAFSIFACTFSRQVIRLTWMLASRSRRERGPLTEMFTIIENGEVFGPEPMGGASLLLAGTKILKVGEIDASAFERLGLGVEVIDAAGC